MKASNTLTYLNQHRLIIQIQLYFYVDYDTHEVNPSYN